MKELPIPFMLFAVSVFMILDLDGFNKLFDVVNGFYLVFLLPVFLLYNHRRASYDAEQELKQYSYNRKKEGRSGSWQESFAGKWVKIERKGFYEFMLWNGVPSIVASFKKDADFGQNLSFDPHDPDLFELRAFGTPSLNLPWIRVGKSEEDAELVDCKDPSGSPMQLKFWFDENEKALKSYGVNPTNLKAFQTRRIDDHGILHFSHTNTRPDGSTITYTATLRKVSQ